MKLLRLLLRALWLAFELAVIAAGALLGFLYLPQISPTATLSSRTQAASAQQQKRSPLALAKVELEPLRYFLARCDASLSLAEVIRRCPPLPPSLSSEEFYAARALILDHPAPLVRQHLIDRLYQRWATLDCEGAVASSMSLSSPQLLQLALRHSATAWAKQDEPAAWAWAEQLEDPVLQNTAVDCVLAQSCTQQPALAAKRAEDLTPPTLQLHALTLVARALASRDASAAQTWAMSLAAEILRAQLVPQIFANELRTAPPIFDALASEPNPAVRREAYAILFAQWARQDPRMLLEWLAKLDLTPELQRPLFEAAINMKNIAANELINVAETMPEGPPRDAFTCGIALSQARTGNTNEAWQILLESPPSIERNAALITLGQAIASTTSSPSSGQWIHDLPASSDRDHLIVGLAQGCNTGQPKLALEWLAQMQDIGWRHQCTVTYFEPWRAHDAIHALAWLWSTPLLAVEEKKRLAR